jgi:hypothetical protein
MPFSGKAPICMEGDFHNGLNDLRYFLVLPHTPKALGAGSLLRTLISKCAHCFRARS